jgi:heat shock protein HslJ
LAAAAVWMNLLGAGAVAGAVRSAATAEPPATLDGTSWRLVRLPPIDAAPFAENDARRLDLSFEDGSVRGFTRCNQIGGKYALDGNRLVLGVIAMSGKPCDDDELTRLELAFAERFHHELAIAIEGGQLRLTAPDGGVIELVAIAPPSLEEIAWVVTGFEDGSRNLVSPPAGASMPLSFADGEVTTHGGCNMLRAGYAIVGSRINIGTGFGLGGTSSRVCPAEGVMEREQQFFTALKRAGFWRVRGDVLDLFSEDGEQVVTARRRGR